MDAAGQRNREDEDIDMNFAFTSVAGGTGTHYVTTAAQIPVTKLQQNVNNGTTLSQVVGMVGGVNMGEGVQYVRTLDGGAALTPQLITVPIALPGAKPGDPQQTVQIQVLNPNLIQQQQPKYQMQIPIQGLQGFQQGGAVLTVAYSPEANDGLHLLGNSLPEGVQVLTLPQEMQLVQPTHSQEESKELVQQQLQQQQVFITQNHQIIIGDDSTNNNNISKIVIKEECEESNDDESSQGAESTTNEMSWQPGSTQDLVNYLNKLPPQQIQSLPVSLQQFLRLNPTDQKKPDTPLIEIEISPESIKSNNDVDVKDVTILEGDGTIRIKKKKKYKKKPPKPAKPKPGQVVITTASDGTPVFCCPECQMAYAEKEQLETHLLVHKIERRFICGICGAGLKRKEHLERHKLGHNPERPYVCLTCSKGFKRREHLNLHTVIHSGIKTEMCLECGKGFYRKDHLRKHTRSHESKRARDDGAPNTATTNTGTTVTHVSQAPQSAEITIHVPTSGNVQVPVQINIPQHVVSSLQAQQVLQTNTQTALDALLAQNT